MLQRQTRCSPLKWLNLIFLLKFYKLRSKRTLQQKTRETKVFILIMNQTVHAITRIMFVKLHSLYPRLDTKPRFIWTFQTLDGQVILVCGASYVTVFTYEVSRELHRWKIHKLRIKVLCPLYHDSLMMFGLFGLLLLMGFEDWFHLMFEIIWKYISMVTLGRDWDNIRDF